ncbi:MAG: endolytic transglycosylase MltG [Lachnospiraceae bacterium]|nr:endolytic transglycosylase MltG [Lachnospiraceae bacterium]
MDAGKVVMKLVRVCFSLLMIVLVIFILFRAGSYSYQMGYRLFAEEPVSDAPGQDVVVRISEDMSAREIGNVLEARHLIRDGKLFAVQLSISSYKDDIKPGSYTLNTSMTMKEMIQVMAASGAEVESN